MRPGTNRPDDLFVSGRAVLSCRLGGPGTTRRGFFRAVSCLGTNAARQALRAIRRARAVLGTIGKLPLIQFEIKHTFTR
jgi:hypothetical protein